MNLYKELKGKWVRINDSNVWIQIENYTHHCGAKEPVFHW